MKNGLLYQLNKDNAEKKKAHKLGKASRGNYDTWMPNGFVKEDKNEPQYRMGALTVGYKGYKIGIDSDRYVRHPAQDIFAHNIMSHQPGFQTLSNTITPYFKYQVVS
jgi:hypothetical protein